MDVEKSKPVTRDAKVFRKYFVESTLDPQQKRLLSMNMKVKDQNGRMRQQEEIAQIFRPITKDRVSKLMTVNMQSNSQSLSENITARKMVQSRDGSTNKEGQPQHTLIANLQVFDNKVMNREVEYLDSNKVSARQIEQAFRNRKQIQIKSFSSSSANRDNETSMNSNGLIHSIFSQNTFVPMSRVQNTRLSNSEQRDNIDSNHMKFLKNSLSTPSFRKSYEIQDFKTLQADNKHFSLAKKQIYVYKAKQERRSIFREEKQSNDFVEEICENVQDRIVNYQKNSNSGSVKKYPQSDAVSNVQSNKSGYNNTLGLKSYSVDNFMNSQGLSAFQTTPNFIQQKVDQQIGTEELAPPSNYSFKPQHIQQIKEDRILKHQRKKSRTQAKYGENNETIKMEQR
ncbi:UNKNOWN [Stylonychia lemnae]|uniref:Uncharacterized protein n=1 Tax=Stylonychia lemnae TaxID=5949 RepID=A0A078BE07_STYLE|nr:UNKNOWN [Stylonychia lemnae]|eukprot:CDW91382.1 UNKNOWN [Stylonychia lemnae]